MDMHKPHHGVILSSLSPCQSCGSDSCSLISCICLSQETQLGIEGKPVFIDVHLLQTCHSQLNGESSFSVLLANRPSRGRAGRPCPWTLHLSEHVRTSAATFGQCNGNSKMCVQAPSSVAPPVTQTEENHYVGETLVLADPAPLSAAANGGMMVPTSLQCAGVFIIKTQLILPIGGSPLADVGGAKAVNRYSNLAGFTCL